MVCVILISSYHTDVCSSRYNHFYQTLTVMKLKSLLLYSRHILLFTLD